MKIINILISLGFNPFVYPRLLKILWLWPFTENEEKFFTTNKLDPNETEEQSRLFFYSFKKVLSQEKVKKIRTKNEASS